MTLTRRRAAGQPRRVRYNAELDTAIIRITPTRIISFGIDDADTEPHQLVPDIRNV